jgi:hypothetical protein
MFAQTMFLGHSVVRNTLLLLAAERFEMRKGHLLICQAKKRQNAEAILKT